MYGRAACAACASCACACAAWEKGEGRAGTRRVVSFHPEGRTDANGEGRWTTDRDLDTEARPDYTKGKVEEYTSTLSSQSIGA